MNTIQLKLPIIEFPTITVQRDIQHEPFNYNLITVKTIEEEKKEELTKNCYIIYHQINELERYNDNGYLPHEQYKEITTQLLNEYQVYQSNKLYKSIQSKLSLLVEGFPLAIKRITINKPNNCSCINQIKALIDSKHSNQRIFTNQIENNKYVSKLLYYTSMMDNTIMIELQKLQQNIDCLLNSQIIIPPKIIESFEKDFISIINKYSI